MATLQEMKSNTARKLRQLGVDILSERRRNAANADEMQRRVFEGRDVRVIFDCGANRGRVAKEYTAMFPKAKIYSFEPTPATFEGLKKEVAGLANVEPVNAAVGETAGQLDFYLGAIEQSNTLVKPSPDAKPAFRVPVVNLADFCRERKIEHIDILKLDVEGYELPALKGIDPMFQSRRIDAVFTEVLFDPEPGATTFLQQMEFLTSRGFKYFGMYDLQYFDSLRAMLGDVFFVREDVLKAYEARLR